MKKNAQQKNKMTVMDGKDKIWRVGIASMVVLVFLMISFLILTLNNSKKLAENSEIISAHPFEVVISAGDIKTDISRMQMRTERLNKHNTPEDLELIRDALDGLRIDIQTNAEKIKRLYLGSQETVDELYGYIDKLYSEQNKFLEFVQDEENNLKDVEEYHIKNIEPLYEDVLNSISEITESAQNIKVKYGQTAETIRLRTLVGSVLIVIVILIVLLMNQYTLRKQRRELILRSKLFDNLSTSIDDSFLIRDADTGELYYTALNIERVLGYKINVIDDIYKGFSDKDTEEIKAAMRDKNLPFSKTYEYTCQNREKNWMSVRIYQTKHTKTSQIISVLSNCTEEIIARQALQNAMMSAEQANAAKSDFLSRMSHEIRTPLNAIIGMTAIAASSVNSPAKVEDCLTKINFSSKHLLMLTNDVLDMSKIESNKMSLQSEPFDLSQVISSFSSTIFAQAKAKGVEYSQKMCEFNGMTQYIGDPLRLNQILLNLGSNAVKFTPPGGKVTLTVSRIASKAKTDTIRFVIKDTGIGMTHDALKRVFKPFEQADETIAGKFGGTGLGMSITQNLVELNSGRLDIQSEPNVGTVCTVDLSLKRDRQQKAQPDFESLGLRALVADDEAGVCKDTALLLENIKISSDWVTTGSEAVERVTKAERNGRGYDFCLIDWKIPDIDGIEITRQIRANVGFDLPIILISAYDSSEIEEAAREAGVNAFLPKPIYRSSISTVLQAAFCTRKDGDLAADDELSEKDMLKGKRLLIAEDNELNREIISELLSMNGIDSICADDGEKAVNEFLSHPAGYFDAILMDVQMPIMNGYEATAKIRTCERADGKRIPIIATTANAFSDDISAALAAGMNAHISKPINIEQLCGELVKEIYKK